MVPDTGRIQNSEVARAEAVDGSVSLIVEQFENRFYPPIPLLRSCVQFNVRITKEDYDTKLQELTDRLQRLNIELGEHTQADHDYKTTVATVLSVARRSREIFEGAELHEKRQFINFLVQNPELKDRKLLLELRSPFNLVLNLSDYIPQKSKTISFDADRLAWLRGWDSPSCRFSAENRTQDQASACRLLTTYASGRSHPTDSPQDCPTPSRANKNPPHKTVNFYWLRILDGFRTANLESLMAMDQFI